MTEQVLHIRVSPRGERSLSTQIADEFLFARSQQKALSIDLLDVWSDDLPEVNGALLEAKYAGLSGTPLTSEQQAAWASIRRLSERFHRATTLLFSVPLWNFGVPYKLKHLIDAVSHKNLLFSFDGARFEGLLRGRKAVCIYTRGLSYEADSRTPASEFDLQKPYLDAWFRFVGIEAVHTIIAEQTIGTNGTQIREQAMNDARALGRSLA